MKVFEPISLARKLYGIRLEHAHFVDDTPRDPRSRPHYRLISWLFSTGWRRAPMLLFRARSSSTLAAPTRCGTPFCGCTAPDVAIAAAPRSDGLEVIPGRSLTVLVASLPGPTASERDLRCVGVAVGACRPWLISVSSSRSVACRYASRMVGTLVCVQP